MAYRSSGAQRSENYKDLTMKHCTIVSSLVSDSGMTQAGLAYLATSLQRLGCNFNLIDMSGTIDYFNAPKELYTPCNSHLWMNPKSITHYGLWMEDYIGNKTQYNEIVFFSALFSPDVVFHSYISNKIKTANSDIITAIGGAALSSLTEHQLNFLSQFFDYLLVGYDVEVLVKSVLSNQSKTRKTGRIVRSFTSPTFAPDYSLINLRDFVTVYSGHGCYYGQCRFCDYPQRSIYKISYRNPKKVARDVHKIFQLRPSIKDIVLSIDAYTKKHIKETAEAIYYWGGKIPYNVMMRAETWISKEIGMLLEKSGCTDVFIGAEALDNSFLEILNKGISTKDISNAVKILSQFVDVTMGLILFIPRANEDSFQIQLKNLEALLPYLSSIEPEILTLVNGSAFAQDPESFGIIPYATRYVLNDSWCFGLSPDIPWTMADRDTIRRWLIHADEIHSLCSECVKREYWDAINQVRLSFADGSRIRFEPRRKHPY